MTIFDHFQSYLQNFSTQAVTDHRSVLKEIRSFQKEAGLSEDFTLNVIRSFSQLPLEIQSQCLTSIGWLIYDYLKFIKEKESSTQAGPTLCCHMITQLMPAVQWNNQYDSRLLEFLSPLLASHKIQIRPQERNNFFDDFPVENLPKIIRTINQQGRATQYPSVYQDMLGGMLHFYVEHKDQKQVDTLTKKVETAMGSGQLIKGHNLYRLLSVYYYSINDFSKSEEFINKALRLSQDWYLYSTKSELEFGQNRPASALYYAFLAILQNRNFEFLVNVFHSIANMLLNTENHSLGLSALSIEFYLRSEKKWTIQPDLDQLLAQHKITLPSAEEFRPMVKDFKNQLKELCLKLYSENFYTARVEKFDREKKFGWIRLNNEQLHFRQNAVLGNPSLVLPGADVLVSITDRLDRKKNQVSKAAELVILL